MNTIDSIRQRRSIRKYKPDPVPRAAIKEVLAAAILAPSGKNRQPWKFLVYQGAAKAALLDEMEKGIARETGGQARMPGSAYGLPDARNTLRVMRKAPVAILVMNTEGASPFGPLDTDARFGELCNTLSIGAAIENLILRAEELGLGTLWVGNTCFAYEELMRHLGEPGQLIGAVALGWPDEAPKARPRKPLEEVVEWREE